MGWYDFALWLHVIGACVLLGTGSGIAFFMVMAHRTRKARLVAHVASTVVVADFVFTATAVVAQPVTGVALIWIVGYPFGEHHTNAKKAFATAFDLEKPTGMDGALQIAGLPLEGTHHRGEDDHPPRPARPRAGSPLYCHALGRRSTPVHTARP